MPLGFDMDLYIADALIVMRGKPIDIELLFDRRTAPWVKDRQWHSTQKLIPTRDSQLRMKLQVADTRELVGWILSFGSGVRVLGPDSLRERVCAEAQKIFRSGVLEISLE